MSINCFNFAALEIKFKYRKIQIIMTFALIMNDWNNYKEQYIGIRSFGTKKFFLGINHAKSNLPAGVFFIQ